MLTIKHSARKGAFWLFQITLILLACSTLSTQYGEQCSCLGWGKSAWVFPTAFYTGSLALSLSLIWLITSTVNIFFKTNLKGTLALRSFGLLKIPLLLYVDPVVEKIDSEECRVRIPLFRNTKNHLNSMYFAALAAGADSAGGLAAMLAIQESGHRISLVFKDFHAEFLKRPEETVTFVCRDGAAMKKLVEKAAEVEERVEDTVSILAIVDSRGEEDPVARFKLTISLKKKK